MKNKLIIIAVVGLITVICGQQHIINVQRQVIVEHAVTGEEISMALQAREVQHAATNAMTKGDVQ